jgi:rubrerythrin
MIGSFLDRFRRGAGKPFEVEPLLSPGEIWPIIDVWIAQAVSLRALRKYDYEKQKLKIAESAALKRAAEQPDSKDVWFSLGRIYLAANQPDEATQAFQTLQKLATKGGNARLAQQAFDEQVRASRLRTAIEQSLKGKAIESMFYTCQACGHPILFLGSHCPHCKFAPSSREEVAIGVTLSTLHLHVPTLLQVSREIQKGRKPGEFMPELEEMARQAGDGRGVLSKLERCKADDHLDFRMLETCHHCEAVSNPSWVRECQKCNTPLDRPELVELAICIDHLIQHLVWNIRRDKTESFSDFVTLLVNIKGNIVRNQTGPTDTERKWAHRLLVAISPIFTENGGGFVEVKSQEDIRGKVVDLSVNPNIGLTVDHLEGELRNFARLTSDQVGLF